MLADLAWNVRTELLSASEAFTLYERNGRYVDPKAMTPREAALVERLAATPGGGILHV